MGYNIDRPVNCEICQTQIKNGWVRKLSADKYICEACAEEIEKAEQLHVGDIDYMPAWMSTNGS